jgi:hypothetical protein
MCGNEYYSCVDGAFRLHTTGSYRIAKRSLDKNYIHLHLNELHYMLYMFHVVHNQQILNIHALADVMTYAAASLSFT